MPTKAKLEDENKQLKERLQLALSKEESFKEAINQALKTILEDNCSEAIQPIEEFCADIGVDFPTRQVVLEVPFGVELGDLEDSEYNDIDYTVIDDNYES